MSVFPFTFINEALGVIQYHINHTQWCMPVVPAPPLHSEFQASKRHIKTLSNTKNNICPSEVLRDSPSLKNGAGPACAGSSPRLSHLRDLSTPSVGRRPVLHRSTHWSVLYQLHTQNIGQTELVQNEVTEGLYRWRCFSWAGSMSPH